MVRWKNCRVYDHKVHTTATHDVYFESNGQTLAVNLSQEEVTQHTQLVYVKLTIIYVDNHYQDI